MFIQGLLFNNGIFLMIENCSVVNWYLQAPWARKVIFYCKLLYFKWVTHGYNRLINNSIVPVNNNQNNHIQTHIPTDAHTPSYTHTQRYAHTYLFFDLNDLFIGIINYVYWFNKWSSLHFSQFYHFKILKLSNLELTARITKQIETILIFITRIL